MVVFLWGLPVKPSQKLKHQLKKGTPKQLGLPSPFETNPVSVQVQRFPQAGGNPCPPTLKACRMPWNAGLGIWRTWFSKNMLDLDLDLDYCCGGLGLGFGLGLGLLLRGTWTWTWTTVAGCC